MRNGGNHLEKAPNGADSKLFATLLDYYKGNRTEALKAKAKTYKNEFIRWFGDWTGNYEAPKGAEQYKEVSKVVDENGEPFVVYHNTRAQFDKFDRNKIRTGDGFFFTVDNKPLKAFGNIQIPVYINAKNIKETDSEAPTGDDFNFRNDGFDGMQYFYMDSEAFIIPNSNQIKHVENLGTFNSNDPNIYYNLRDEDGNYEDEVPYEPYIDEESKPLFQRLRQLEIELQDVKQKQSEINTKLAQARADTISKTVITINGMKMRFIEKPNKLIYIDTDSSIFSQVTAHIHIKGDAIESQLLFPSRRIFDDDINYNRIENSIKENTIRIIYELLSVLRDNNQKVVRSPWMVEHNPMFTDENIKRMLLK